jgi:hypothetical protein
VADGGEVDPDLVGAAGFEPALQEARHRVAAGPGVALEHLPVGDGRPATGTDRHFVTGLRVAVDGLVDCSFRARRHAPDECEVGALQRPGAAVIRKLGRELAMGAVGLCHHQQSARVLVEPVHDPRAAHAADSGQAVAAVRDQRVDQRTGPVSRGRMHNETARLVEHDDGVVLVDDVERDRLRARCGLRLRHRDGDRVIGADLAAGIADLRAGDRDLTGEHERLEP